MIGIQIKADLRALMGIIPDRTIMVKVGSEAAKMIVKRTLQGYDFEGKAFKPYSPAYLKQRANRGFKNPKVTLSVTNQMLGDIGVVSANHGEVFVGLLTPAERLKGSANMARGREFMGLTEEEAEKIARLIEFQIFKGKRT